MVEPSCGGFCVRKQSRDRLVDLVGDGGRQLAHGRDPIRVGQLGRGLAQSIFGSLLVVDVGRRTDKFKDFSFRIAKDHGLLEVPAIDAILSAERPAFKCEPLSRLHAFPKTLGCELPIFGMDRGHPGLWMRPDKIECLTGKLKPNSIHEIRRPIGLERPGGYGKLLQKFNLKPQIGAG